ncbi:uncharacterized protein AB675_2924 [Cyphellophora attinorum]|uniref:BHLH domain-containing protein n=1 Tax=Cyphellophora attinorum TaxID=1664694 RepID=A0A0N1H4R4_9EURO|nr:uncharacterized protein AB675_2924 [Phialophora attinorum]KPI36420.1 hypothetical protein AB675_2924 [Phialophora attinorum]
MSAPYIKSEPDEFGNDPNRYMQNHNFNNHGNFDQYFNDQQGGSIDPSALSMFGGNSGGMQYGSGYNNMSNSYSNMGTSAAFDDSELMEGLGDPNQMDDYNAMSSMNQQQARTKHSMPINASQVYSSTPDGAPIQSPYLGQPDYNHFRNLSSIPQHLSPLQGPGFMSGSRPGMSAHRKSSDQRSPMTPRTAAMANLQIGTPESGSLANGRPIRSESVQNRHMKTMSGQYDSTPGSLNSYLDSPLSSPGKGQLHAGIGETMGGAHASLPTKVEGGHSSSAQESLEAKKRRRRASHNAVERRRRDNINERIQDLSHLVPMHRLEDDKVKKQMATAGPLSPSMGPTGISPPNAATSLLAGASGRRAASTAGNITMGLPIEDRDKGPNKGDILNGSVSWTRDLMWALHQKYLQEAQLATLITQLGGEWPFPMDEDDKRMRSEVMEAMEKNDVKTFAYTRFDGSGLRVPRYTNLTGDKIPSNNSMSPNSNFEMSPGFNSGASGSGSNGPGQTQYWNTAGHVGISFKEEDEEDMDM